MSQSHDGARLGAADTDAAGLGVDSGVVRPLYGAGYGARIAVTEEEDERFGELTEQMFEENIDRVLAEVKGILLRKHADYGPGNIADTPGGPMNGLRVRAFDKVARISNLVDGRQPAFYESLEDSWIDLMGYSLIATLVMRAQWPGLRGER